MQLKGLILDFEHNQKQSYESINQLLDYYQKKYIAGDIDIVTYRKIFHYLDEQGAKSSHEYVII